MDPHSQTSTTSPAAHATPAPRSATMVVDAAGKLDAAFEAACMGGKLEIATISVYVIARPSDDNSMDLAAMVDAVQAGRFPGIRMVVGDRARQTGRRMKNCEIFRADAGEGVVATIKAFCNGSMHVTGAKSFRNSAHVVRRFADAYAETVGVALRLEEIVPCMVNVNGDCGRELDLRSFCKRWVATTTYDPSKHHSLQVHVGPVRGKTPPKPYAKKKAARVQKDTQYLINVLVFSTGGIMITGAKSPEDVRLAYETVFNGMIPEVGVVVSPSKRLQRHAEGDADVSPRPARRPRISAREVEEAENALANVDLDSLVF